MRNALSSVRSANVHSWNSFRLTPYSLTASVALIILCVWAAWPTDVPTLLRYDVFGYYLYLPLTFIYNDLGLHDQTGLRQLIDYYNSTPTLYQAFPLDGQDGMVLKYSMGMAISYAPFFFVAHLIAPIAGYPADGFSAPYEWAIWVGSMVYLIGGVLLLRKLLLRYFSDKISALVIILIVIGTNYYHISTITLGMPHGFLFFMYAGLLLVTDNWHRQPTVCKSIILGAMLGLMALARPTELAALIIPLFWGVTSWRKFLEKIKTVWRDHRTELLILGFVMVVIGSFQLIYWKIATGHFFYYSYGIGTGEGFDFLRPHLYEVLFSFRKGWYLYTPIMLFATAGFIFLKKHYKPLLLPVGLFFILNLYLVSSWSTWWYAESFSQRALVQSYPVMALGLGALLQTARGWVRLWKAGMAAILVFFVLLNQFQIWQLNHGILDSSRMTAKYYWAAFLKTEANPKWRKYLLVERNDDGLDHFESGDHYDKGPAWHMGFEGLKQGLEAHYTSDTIHGGDRAFRMKMPVEFSPGISIPYRKITTKDHAWLKLSFWVFPEVGDEPLEHSIVVTFRHKEGNYKYRAINLDDDQYELTNGTWNQLEMDYLTPEIRDADDELNVYVWRRGTGAAIYDDFQVQSYITK